MRLQVVFEKVDQRGEVADFLDPEGAEISLALSMGPRVLDNAAVIGCNETLNHRKQVFLPGAAAMQKNNCATWIGVICDATDGEALFHLPCFPGNTGLRGAGC